MNTAGPQRVLLSTSSSRVPFQPADGEGELSAFSRHGNEINSDGRLQLVTSGLRLNKRKRDERDENDTSTAYENESKRFRGADVEQVCHCYLGFSGCSSTLKLRQGSCSPRTNRPSSVMSARSTTRSYHPHSTPGGSHPYDQRDHHPQTFFGPTSPIEQLPRDTGSHQTFSKQPSALDRLLTFHCDEYLQQRAEFYTALCTKWTECPISEWKAGSESGPSPSSFSQVTELSLEVHSNFRSLADFVRFLMNIYSSLWR